MGEKELEARKNLKRKQHAEPAVREYPAKNNTLFNRAFFISAAFVQSRCIARHKAAVVDLIGNRKDEMKPEIESCEG